MQTVFRKHASRLWIVTSQDSSKFFCFSSQKLLTIDLENVVIINVSRWFGQLTRINVWRHFESDSEKVKREIIFCRLRLLWSVAGIAFQINKWKSHCIILELIHDFIFFKKITSTLRFFNDSKYGKINFIGLQWWSNNCCLVWSKLIVRKFYNWKRKKKIYKKKLFHEA